MDNCEVYRGLRDFADVLRLRGEAVDGNYFDAFADGIVTGISTILFDTVRSGFIAGDDDIRAGKSFYPGATCQVFPQALGLTELSAYFNKAWSYLDRVKPNWQDGRYDAYPWAILGFVAAKRGLTTQAQAQLKTVQQSFASNRSVVTINELGFYQRTISVLAGRADS